MLCKSGSAFPTVFEFAVWKQDHLPLQGSIDLIYPQVPPFPHVEDYLWPDFSNDADAFFEQFEEPEELASYRSEAPHLPPVPCFDTLVDQRRIKYFQGWEFEEGDI